MLLKIDPTGTMSLPNLNSTIRSIGTGMVPSGWCWPRAAHTSQHVLQVPQQHMDKAEEAMKKVGVKGRIKNMSGTKRRTVKA